MKNKTKRKYVGGASINNINRYLLNTNFIELNDDLQLLLKIINSFKINSRPIKLDVLINKVSTPIFNIIKSLGKINEENKLILISDLVLEFEIELKIKLFIYPIKKNYIKKQLIYYDDAKILTSMFSHNYILEKYKFPILPKKTIPSTYEITNIDIHVTEVVPYIICYDIIIIPLSINIDGGSLSDHLVSLVFRKSNNTFEYYDPLGNHDTYLYIFEYIHTFIEILKIQHKIIIDFDKNNQIKRGLQSLQVIQQKRLELNYTYEPDGFCYMWNIFFWELIIQNPTLNNNEIISKIIFYFMHDLNKIIVGYILYMQKQLNIELRMYNTIIDDLFTLEKVSSTKAAKHLSIINELIIDLNKKLRIPYVLCE
jgi:hypothetical protein